MSDKPLKSKKFRELQKKWYDKLKKDGFEDIEWVDHKTGVGQNSSFLKNSLSTRKKACEGGFASSKRFQYYRLASNFLHNYKDFKDLADDGATKPNRGATKPRAKSKSYKTNVDYELWKLHTEGSTYREISRSLKSLFRSPKRFSVYWVYYRVKRLQDIMLQWNKTNSEGLLASELEEVIGLDRLDDLNLSDMTNPDNVLELNASNPDASGNSKDPFASATTPPSNPFGVPDEE